MTADPSRKVPETPFGIRLRAARKMAGMSMEDLAAKLGGRVTKQAISKYETGRMMPSPEVLERLVEVLKDATWGASPLRVEDGTLDQRLPFDDAAAFGTEAGLSRLALRRRGLLSLLKKDEMIGRVERTEASRDDAAMSEIKFRAGEKLSAKTEAALKYRIADHLQKYLELESVLGRAAAFENPVGEMPARTAGEVEVAAAEVRRRWELGSGPIVNLLGLIEEKGIKVYEAKGIEGFEGLSGRFGLCPFVAVSKDRPADRVRFTAAHELGHILCGFSEGGEGVGLRRDGESPESPEGTESRCHAFGAAFLLPRSALERTFAPARRKMTLGELGEIKQTYGVSLQAIMYRAHGLGLVSDRQLRGFRETIKAKGWVVEEPVAYTGPERATRFRRLLHYAVAAGIMNTARAAELAGVEAGELEKEIGDIF